MALLCSDAPLNEVEDGRHIGRRGPGHTGSVDYFAARSTICLKRRLYSCCWGCSLLRHFGIVVEQRVECDANKCCAKSVKSWHIKTAIAAVQVWFMKAADKERTLPKETSEKVPPHRRRLRLSPAVLQRAHLH